MVLAKKNGIHLYITITPVESMSGSYTVQDAGAVTSNRKHSIGIELNKTKKNMLLKVLQQESQ